MDWSACLCLDGPPVRYLPTPIQSVQREEIWWGTVMSQRIQIIFVLATKHDVLRKECSNKKCNETSSAFPIWSHLLLMKGMKLDTELAMLLLDRYVNKI